MKHEVRAYATQKKVGALWWGDSPGQAQRAPLELTEQ